MSQDRLGGCLPDPAAGDCTTTEVDAVTATIGTETEPTASDGCKECVLATAMRRGAEELTTADAESCGTEDQFETPVFDAFFNLAILCCFFYACAKGYKACRGKHKDTAEEARVEDTDGPMDSSTNKCNRTLALQVVGACGVLLFVVAWHAGSTPSGKDVCEGRDINGEPHRTNEQSCLAPGCCHWDGSSCLSHVGEGPCPGGTAEGDSAAIGGFISLAILCCLFYACAKGCKACRGNHKDTAEEARVEDNPTESPTDSPTDSPMVSPTQKCTRTLTLQVVGACVLLSFFVAWQRDSTPSGKDVCEGRNLADEQACLEPECCHWDRHGSACSSKVGEGPCPGATEMPAFAVLPLLASFCFLCCACANCCKACNGKFTAEEFKVEDKNQCIRTLALQVVGACVCMVPITIALIWVAGSYELAGGGYTYETFRAPEFVDYTDPNEVEPGSEPVPGCDGVSPIGGAMNCDTEGCAGLTFIAGTGWCVGCLPNGGPPLTADNIGALPAELDAELCDSGGGAGLPACVIDQIMPFVDSTGDLVDLPGLQALMCGDAAALDSSSCEETGLADVARTTQDICNMGAGGGSDVGPERLCEEIYDSTQCMGNDECSWNYDLEECYTPSTCEDLYSSTTCQDSGCIWDDSNYSCSTPCSDEQSACGASADCLAIIEAAPNSPLDQDACNANAECAAYMTCQMNADSGSEGGNSTPCSDEQGACDASSECVAILQAAPPNSRPDQAACSANAECATYYACVVNNNLPTSHLPGSSSAPRQARFAGDGCDPGTDDASGVPNTPSIYSQPQECRDYWDGLCEEVVVVPSNVTDIPSGALKRCESLGGLATLKIPDSISTMDVWDCKDVSCPLNGCSGAALGTRYCSGYDGVHAGRDAFKDAGSTTVVCVYTDGAAITNNTWAPSCELECNRGYSFPAFEQLQPTRPAPRECTRCPFPKRCPGGSATDPACKEGSQGPGCVQCSRKWFTFGHRCAECPETAVEGLVSFLAGLAAVAIFVVKVWGCTALQPVSKLEEQRKKFNNRVTNLESNIETGKQQKSEQL
eukprot:COSAG06_NODE_3443_length_5343_cov_2.163806_1_plen_1049_part_00